MPYYIFFTFLKEVQELKPLKYKFLAFSIYLLLDILFRKQYIPPCPDKSTLLEYIIEQSSNESMIKTPFGCTREITETEKALLKLIVILFEDRLKAFFGIKPLGFIYLVIFQ